jgi:hypothetical protein
MRFAFVALLAVAACHHDPQPIHPKPGDLPPLPPASGTPVGYLIDSAGDLKLRDDQLKQLKDIDQSLAAQDADIDVQLSQIEKPEEEEQMSPQDQKAGKKRARYNNAPGASVQGNADSQKLHALRNENDRAALKKAWAILDPEQQKTAAKILDERGVEVPGAQKKQAPTSDDGKPLPGMEP